MGRMQSAPVLAPSTPLPKAGFEAGPAKPLLNFGPGAQLYSLSTLSSTTHIPVPVLLRILQDLRVPMLSVGAERYVHSFGLRLALLKWGAPPGIIDTLRDDPLLYPLMLALGATIDAGASPTELRTRLRAFGTTLIHRLHEARPGLEYKELMDEAVVEAERAEPWDPPIPSRPEGVPGNRGPRIRKIGTLPPNRVDQESDS